MIKKENYSWGYNKTHGVLGMGEYLPNEPVFESIPKQVSTLFPLILLVVVLIIHLLSQRSRYCILGDVIDMVH